MRREAFTVLFLVLGCAVVLAAVVEPAAPAAPAATPDG